jgi:hypothetical protein
MTTTPAEPTAYDQARGNVRVLIGAAERSRNDHDSAQLVGAIAIAQALLAVADAVSAAGVRR